MLLRTSRTSSPIMLIGIALLLGVLFLPSFQHLGIKFATEREGALFSPFHALVQHTLYSPLLAVLFVLLIVLLQGRISQKYMLLSNRNYITGLLYVVLCSSIVEIKTLNPAFPAALLILLSLSRFIDSYRREGDAKEFFEGTFYIGIAGLFYPPAVAFVVVSWIALMLFRSFHWREWVFTLIGLSLPYLFLASFYFLSGQDLLLISKPFQAYFTQQANRVLLIPELVYMSIVVLLILVASTYINRRMQAQKVQTNKSYSLFFFVFVVCFFIYFLLPGVGKEIIVIACIPLSFLLSLYFTEAKRNWLIDIIFDLLILGSVLLTFLS